MNLNLKQSMLVVGLGAIMASGYVPQANAAETKVSVSAPQGKVIKGSVQDSEGPLVGATILEKGTTNGTVTDFDGNFSLKLTKENAVLVVSYVGYVTQEFSTAGKTSFNVLLQDEGRNLNEIVVIGYGTQRKESVTGSVASMKGEILREVPGADITQSLQGRVAGVEMTQTSSKPGASMQIRIRGTRSLSASNDPLIVLDGIPFAGSINDIDPGSIKSMDILKDASATAIYGSRGANGVIMITTNKGTKDMKPVIKYNMYVGAKTNFAKYPMMNGPQLKKLRETSGAYQPVYTNGGDEEEGMNTDWQDLLFKTGFTTNQDVSVSGGGSSNSYNIGVSYFKDEAVIPTQDFDRYAMHAALDQEIGKYIKVGFSTNTNYSTTNNANLGIYTTLSASPLINPYDKDGNLKPIVHMEKDNQWTYTRDRIEGLGDKYKDQATTLGTYNNFYGEVKIPYVDGLKYRMNIGLNYRHNKYGSYTGTGIFSDQPSNASGATNNNATTWNWAVEHVLSYDKTFGDHTINAVALYSAEKTHYDTQSMGGQYIPNDQFLWYNIGQAEKMTINPANQGYHESGLESLMARIMYSYKDKYMLSAAVRQDASSRLAKGHQKHTYPAVSVGWNIAKESFMDNVSWVDNLKLRAGYGETSNQAVDPYKTLGLLATNPYNFGTEYQTGYYVSELPNQELGWEYSQTYNVGLDFSLFNGRLSGTVEYYTQKTNNLLLSVSLPSTAGVGSYMANVGKTKNTGVEVSLNGIILDNHNGWTWEAGLNWYTNKNEIVELADGSLKDEGNGWFVGKSINSIYDYEKVGIWQKNEEALRQQLEPGGDCGPGMIKVKYTGGFYQEGDEIPAGKKVGDAKRAINADDRQVIELDPAWEGGFNTRVAYHNFDLSVVGSFRHGGKLISTLYGSASYLNMLTGRRNNINVNYWTEDNPTNDFPSPAGPISNDNPKYGNTLSVFSGSYLKIRSITLGYNFKGEWMKKVGIGSLRAYATVTNPFVLFSPYNDESGMDPETNSRGDENQSVASYNKRILVVGYNTPTTRNYLFGLNVTF